MPRATRSRIFSRERAGGFAVCLEFHDGRIVAQREDDGAAP
jgi:hypothetical protein